MQGTNISLITSCHLLMSSLLKSTAQARPCLLRIDGRCGLFWLSTATLRNSTSVHVWRKILGTCNLIWKRLVSAVAPRSNRCILALWPRYAFVSFRFAADADCAVVDRQDFPGQVWFGYALSSSAGDFICRQAFSGSLPWDSRRPGRRLHL